MNPNFGSIRGSAAWIGEEKQRKILGLWGVESLKDVAQAKCPLRGCDYCCGRHIFEGRVNIQSILPLTDSQQNRLLPHFLKVTSYEAT